MARRARRRLLRRAHARDSAVVDPARVLSDGRVRTTPTSLEGIGAVFDRGESVEEGPVAGGRLADGRGEIGRLVHLDVAVVRAGLHPATEDVSIAGWNEEVIIRLFECCGWEQDPPTTWTVWETYEGFSYEVVT